MLSTAPKRDRLIRKTEFARMLGVDSRRLDRLVARDLLPPAIRTSRRYLRWPRSVILEWLRSRGGPRPEKRYMATTLKEKVKSTSRPASAKTALWSAATSWL